ncbi:hypothetical protein BBOR36S_03405 [Brevibacillus borstelensis]
MLRGAVLFRDIEKVIMALRRYGSSERRSARIGDRTGRQAWVQIRIVRTFYLQVVIRNSVPLLSEHELDSGVRLQKPAFPHPVVVYAG